MMETVAITKKIKRTMAELVRPKKVSHNKGNTVQLSEFWGVSSDGDVIIYHAKSEKHAEELAQSQGLVMYGDFKSCTDYRYNPFGHKMTIPSLEVSDDEGGGGGGKKKETTPNKKKDADSSKKKDTESSKKKDPKKKDDDSKNKKASDDESSEDEGESGSSDSDSESSKEK